MPTPLPSAGSSQPSTPSSHHRFRQLVAVILGGAILSVGLIPVASGFAAAYDEPVWEWNIFGGCTTFQNSYRVYSGNCGGTRANDVIVFSVFASQPPNRPWAIALNEVCYTQALDLYNRLQPAGYSGKFYITNGAAVPGLPSPPATTHVNCGVPGVTGGTHGNFLLTLGGLLAQPNPAWYSSQEPGGDYRALGCLEMQTYFGTRTSCVTHLDTGPTYRDAQDLQAYYMGAVASSSVAVIVAGDRNNSSVATWQGWWEADQSFTRTFPDAYAQSPNPRKIDWILGSYPGHSPSSTRPSTTYCPSMTGDHPVSDHCLLMSWFTI
jgi:hypothetical protein